MEHAGYVAAAWAVTVAAAGGYAGLVWLRTRRAIRSLEAARRVPTPPFA